MDPPNINGHPIALMTNGAGAVVANRIAEPSRAGASLKYDPAEERERINSESSRCRPSFSVPACNRSFSLFLSGAKHPPQKRTMSEKLTYKVGQYQRV